MNDFKTTYRDAVSGIETVHIDVDSVLDEARRKRLRAHRSRQKLITMAVMGGILCICTFGTVQAADYIKTVIKVNAYGFESADMVTISRSEKGVAGQGEEGIAPAGGLAEEEAAALEETKKMADDELVIEALEDTTQEYDSVEAFRKENPALFVLPDLEGLGYGVDSEKIWVNGNFISAQLSGKDKYIFFDRMDYSDAKEGHASSTVYAGGVYNERKFTTESGYEYILVDSKEEAQSDEVVIHAAISVGYYELYADFYGYEESEVMQILESMDLSVYEPGAE